jgi:hypothetical protein
MIGDKNRRWLLLTILTVASVGVSCKARSSPTDSQRLDKFLKQVAEANPVPIVFGVLGQDSGNMALTTYEPTRTFIQIKEGLEPDLRQNVEVHELFHIQLQHEGYPSKFPGFGIPSLDDPPKIILDCISHPMIDSRMRAAGWKPELLLRSIVEYVQAPTTAGQHPQRRLPSRHRSRPVLLVGAGSAPRIWSRLTSGSSVSCQTW